MGYAGQASVLPGEPITLYVSTTARSFTVKAFRMGWYNGDLARLVWRSKTVPGHRQRKPTLIKPANTVETRLGAVAHGAYRRLAGGFVPAAAGLRERVRSGSSRSPCGRPRPPGKTVIKNGVETWQAYNTWGGYDLYNGPGGVADYNNRSLAVSLDRPYDQNGAYMFLFHERKLIALAERLGMPLAYVTSMDIAADPHLLDGASALFSLGHDEYWSPPERANVTAARNTGHEHRLPGRELLLPADPAGQHEARPAAAGHLLQDQLPAGPGVREGQRAGHQRLARAAEPGSRVVADRHAVRVEPHQRRLCGRLPATPGCSPGPGVQKGTRFPGLVGIEYDRVNPDSPVERPIEILSHSPLTCRGVNSYSDSAYYTHSSGAGVFNTGTMRWVASFGGWYQYGLNGRTAALHPEGDRPTCCTPSPAARPRPSTRPTTTWMPCTSGPATRSPPSTTSGPRSTSEGVRPAPAPASVITAIWQVPRHQRR